jgi:hypothetical protein
MQTSSFFGGRRLGEFISFQGQGSGSRRGAFDDDPAFGMKFQMILDGIPDWKKYKAQDHSLFITGPEQKADYFLTDGSSYFGRTKEVANRGITECLQLKFDTCVEIILF